MTVDTMPGVRGDAPEPVGQPPSPPRCFDDGDGRDDGCARCPTRLAVQAYLETASGYHELPWWSRALLGFMGGTYLGPDQKTVAATDRVLLATYVPGCPKPSGETKRWRIPLPDGKTWQFGRYVLRCSNPSVPIGDRERYFSEIAE